MTQSKQTEDNFHTGEATTENTNSVQSSPSLFSYEHLLERVKDRLKYSLTQPWGSNISLNSAMGLISLATRDIMVERLLETEQAYNKADVKRLYYLSMEFLVGRSLGNNLINLNILEFARDILKDLGKDIEEVREEELDAALGNGGLGRLAACFLDSLASLDMPGFGYGINYEYGLFKQHINEDGEQIELPDAWRRNTSPWLIERPGEQVTVALYGRVEDRVDYKGVTRQVWCDNVHLIGLPSDMPIVGYGGKTVNYLRLYTAKAFQEFDIEKFNKGEYVKAVETRIASETVSKVLYPSDAMESGRELRLVQEYFFVACAIRDIIRRYLKKNSTFDNFPDKVAIQLNDTHPALAVAELMRVLYDENNLPWEKAWEITVATLGYTNHTLLPEALEKWPVTLFEKVLPRHLQIIYEINDRFLREIESKWPGDTARMRNMSIVEESDGYKEIRMAYLAIVGSHAVNGVAALHSELVKTQLVPQFYEYWPERFSNKTNGVTQRRWLLKANPGLAKLLNDSIGNGWVRDLDELKGIEKFAEDPNFRSEFDSIKLQNKKELALYIKETLGITVDTGSIFDVIAKRIHEYKRQSLMILRVLHEYLSIIEDGIYPSQPRTYIFAGKAAPGYWAAKQIIKLINDLGALVNNDPKVRDRIKVVFIPDYKVSLAEKIIPAANVSEQISTAGKEASGTGNMKFAMNGALTVGTLDGANIEIREEVGDENLFVFGLTSEEIQRHREHQSYNPWDYYRRSNKIRRVLDTLNSTTFFKNSPEGYQWFFNNVLHQGDKYFLLADFQSYLDTQDAVSELYVNSVEWTKKAILNVARMGKFSSDRTIKEYAQDIWNIKSL